MMQGAGRAATAAAAEHGHARPPPAAGRAASLPRLAHGHWAAPAATGLLQFGLAQLLAVLASTAAAVLYARWLSATELAAWLSALALARALALLLEGGLRVALLRRAQAVPAGMLRQVARRQAAWGLVACAMLTLAALWQVRAGGLEAGVAALLLLCCAAHLLVLPLWTPALVALERAGAWGLLGRADAAALLAEFVLPAVLIAAGLPALPALAACMVAARLLRALWLRHAALGLVTAAPGAAVPATPGGAAAPATPDGEAAPATPDGAGAAGAPVPWRDGLAVQGIAGLALVRDQMPLWLLAPWFGAAPAASHMLAATACALVGQAAAATVARVALPRLAALGDAGRWPLQCRMVAWLALLSLPPLLLLPGWLAWADQALWHGKWDQVHAYLPWLMLRMVGGVATTVLAVGALVRDTPWQALRLHAWWTLAEVLVAAAAMAWLGPQGLAMAGSITVWVGVLLFVGAARGQGVPRRAALARLLGLLLARPSLWLMAAAVAWAGLPVWGAPAATPAAASLLLCTAALALAWLGEPASWRRLATRGPQTAALKARRWRA